MSLWLLGVIQGLTEFLPISSSAHLVFLEYLFKIPQDERLVYTVWLHLGTVIALIIFFIKSIMRVFKDRQKLLLIIIGTIPSAILGLLLSDKIETFFQPSFAGFFLIVTGVLLFLTKYSQERFGIWNLEFGISIWSALLIGFAQAIALLPGISRSGATIGAALLLGIKSDEAFEFSFLLSIPAVIGANILKIGAAPYQLRQILQLNTTGWNLVLAGFFSLIFGLIALFLLKRVVSKRRFYLFAFYCWILGIITLLFLK